MPAQFFPTLVTLSPHGEDCILPYTGTLLEIPSWKISWLVASLYDSVVKTSYHGDQVVEMQIDVVKLHNDYVDCYVGGDNASDEVMSLLYVITNLRHTSWKLLQNALQVARYVGQLGVIDKFRDHYWVSSDADASEPLDLHQWYIVRAFTAFIAEINLLKKIEDFDSALYANEDPA